MSTDPLSDAALVARVRLKRDQHAFATLVRRHQGPLRAWLRRLMKGDEATADDLAQETFLTAYRKLEQFRGDAAFATWLHAIAYRQFLMAQRKTRAPSRPAAPMDEPQVSDNLAAISDVRQALATLSPEEYTAIVQSYYFDRSHDEIALVLGSALGTVKSRLHRAKAKLRASLAAWSTEDHS